VSTKPLELWAGSRGLVDTLLSLAWSGYQVDTVRLWLVCSREHGCVLGSWGHRGMETLGEAGLGLGWCGRWAWARPRWLLVVHANQDLEAVPGHDALTSMQ
jgi:hypothetical protein